jgi:hypothetical protein
VTRHEDVKEVSRLDDVFSSEVNTAIPRFNETTGEMEPIGAPVKELGFHNLITDTGLDYIWNAPTYAYGYAYLYNRCTVGTGNTTPAFTDTALANPIANVVALGGSDADVVDSYVAGPPAYWKAVQTYRFSTGAAAGNLTEIGFIPINATLLFSRALIVDADGNPTTLVVEADEILDVTYELRVYLDLTDTIGTFESDGVTYDTVIRMADVDNPPNLQGRLANNSDGLNASISLYDGALGSVTNIPSGSTYAQTYNNGGSWGSYATGSHFQTLTTVTPVGSANWTNGVKAMYVLAPYFKFQISFIDPITGKGIPKVTGEKMSITIRFSWGRYSAT